MKQSEFWIELLTTILAITIVNLIGALIGTWLWNLLIFNIFDLPQLSYWQFYGICCLIELLAPKHRNMSILYD